MGVEDEDVYMSLKEFGVYSQFPPLISPQTLQDQLFVYPSVYPSFLLSLYRVFGEGL